ncbi:Hsp20/alpha crystallin family protein [Bacillus sp. T3]|uniref:Hsp20/alpha crystallin family protein n=1 Tax=Bacillus sp. T3 TaxID=467262 RepID=UPI002980A922|nr:Hsp20/alpha crystallin family protein [Bacillus sp. T3]
MTENEQEHLIIAELPGVNREQIGIDVLGNSVTITVNHSEEITEQDESRKTLRRRQSLSRSSRTVALPFPINEQVVKATYTNGLLQIRIPKKRGKKVIIDQD